VEAEDTVPSGCSKDDADAYDMVVADRSRHMGHAAAAVDQTDVVTFRHSCRVVFQA
jgi:hypothetical protein